MTLATAHVYSVGIEVLAIESLLALREVGRTGTTRNEVGTNDPAASASRAAATLLVDESSRYLVRRISTDFELHHLAIGNDSIRSYYLAGSQRHVRVDRPRAGLTAMLGRAQGRTGYRPFLAHRVYRG